MIDLFLSLAEAISPAPTPPPVPTTPPAILRPVADKPPVLKDLATQTGPIDPPAMPPTKYRLADAAGALFEHDDPEYLRNWIAARNASMTMRYVPRVQLFYPPQQASRCGPSGCR